jgi:hypothetical protein
MIKTQQPANDLLVKSKMNISKKTNITGKSKQRKSQVPSTITQQKTAQLEKEKIAKDALPVKKAPAIRKKTIPKTKLVKADKSGSFNTEPEYLSYYESLRQAIKNTALESYKWYNGDGEVYLSFIIQKDGILKELTIDKQNSTRDIYLLQVARNSISGAAPFEPFPPELGQDSISFSVVISFRPGKMEFGSR